MFTRRHFISSSTVIALGAASGLRAPQRCEARIEPSDIPTARLSGERFLGKSADYWIAELHQRRYSSDSGKISYQDSTSDIIDALAAFGEPVIPHLLGALDSEDDCTRQIAIEAICEMRPVANAALRSAASHSNPSVRKQVLWEANWRRRKVDNVAMNLAISALGDPDASVRTRAARTLALYDHEPNSVIPALRRAFADGNPDVRTQAVRSLERFGDAAVPMLLEALHSADPHLRLPAAFCLSDENTSAVGCDPIGIVLAGLSDRNASVRNLSAELIASVDPFPPAATGQVIELLSDEDAGVRQRAASALASCRSQVGEHSKLTERAGRLLASLASSDPLGLVRAEAVYALTALGIVAAAPTVQIALHDDEAHVRREAIHFAAQFFDANEAQLALDGALSDEDASVRAQAVYALIDARLDARPLVLRATHDRDPAVKEAALRALKSIACGQDDYVRLLTTILADEDPWLRMLAVERLLEVTPCRTRAARVLTDLIDQSNAAISKRAAEILAFCGRFGTERLANSVTSSNVVACAASASALAKYARQFEQDSPAIRLVLRQCLTDEDLAVCAAVTEMFGG